MNGTSSSEAIDQSIEAMLAQRHIPRATYRLQFNADFTFADAAALVPFLQALGISDCYASPILTARAGSTHGYDITDPTLVNPVLGGEEGLLALTTALHAAGMQLIVDMVPNHMGIGDSSNRWWLDVLENGPASSYATYFDIDWQPVKPELANKVLLPILGDQYGNVLEQGQLRLNYDDGAFWLSYFDHRLPIAPRTYTPVLQTVLMHLREALGAEHEHVLELQSILTALSYLPPRTEPDFERLAERNREKEIIKRRVITLYSAAPEVQAALAASIDDFNGHVGNPHSFDQLDALIGAQPYRLAFWRVAAEEINYRRFFDINDLAAIRVEQADVFDELHRLIFQLIDAGTISGLRIDHPDGLWNPFEYFRKLQECYLLGRLTAGRDDDGADEQVAGAVRDWFKRHTSLGSEAVEWPLYVVVEKILSEREPLPRDWAVDGTTGYDFLNTVNGIFVDRRNRAAFDALYRDFVRKDELGDRTYFRQLTYQMKRTIMQVSLGSEITSLAHQLDRIGERNRHYRDFTLGGLTTAIREFIACLAIYRTYIQVEGGVVPDRDRKYIVAAIAEARRRNPGTDASLFTFLEDTLLLRNLPGFSPEDQAALEHFVMRFQQMTGPVMAKGVEDTSFYIYNRLVSLNEVGGNPSEFGVLLATFHRDNVARQRRWPHAMLATSTHDTKRSEDVRARINVLSEMPKEWRAAVERWHSLNESHQTIVEDEAVLDPNDEYLLYQTLVGAWPVSLQPEDGEALDRDELRMFRERILAYMQKATKEAKVHTSWINPNESYDAALRDFINAILPGDGESPFLIDLVDVVRTVADFGWFNGLSQQLLKLTAPGVPDIYQGTELWDLSLVDPDNRRLVDYAQRRALLAQLQSRSKRDGKQALALADELVAHRADGRIKLYLTYRTLRARCEQPDLFDQGSYDALDAVGDQREHVCAFARRHGEQAIVVVVPRLVLGLTHSAPKALLGPEVWGETRLVLPHAHPGKSFRNLFTGEILTVDDKGEGSGLSVGAIFAHFPVALLSPIA